MTRVDPMDSLSIFIIVVSVLLAVVFKWYLFRRIRNWMDRDLIHGLAQRDPERIAWLTRADQDLREQGIKRADRHRRLEQLAASAVSPDRS